MTQELKAQLFDEIVSNLDNDDYIKLDNGTIYYHGGYHAGYESKERYYLIESALEDLGYDVRSTENV